MQQCVVLDGENSCAQSATHFFFFFFFLHMPSTLLFTLTTYYLPFLPLPPPSLSIMQIQAVSTCAFLDIFTPPYDDSSRGCEYFRPAGAAEDVPPLSQGAELLLEAYDPQFVTSTYQPLV